MAELDAILEKYTDTSTGIAHGATFTAMDSRGNTLYRKSVGSRTVDRTEPLTPDTLTWIASQSKLVTSVAGMKVVEMGLIGLDDDVRDVLPQLKDIKVLLGFEGEVVDKGFAGTDVTVQSIMEKDCPKEHVVTTKGKPILEDLQGKITLRQLMSHTSGFSYHVGNPLLTRWAEIHPMKEDMFSGKMEGSMHPLTFQPGSLWQYGPGHDWTGQVIEALTNKDLDRFMQENIWEPLYANSSTFRPSQHFAPNPAPPQQEMAHLVETKTSSGMNIRSLVAGPSPWTTDPRDCIGGAGLYSTSDDFCKLLSALLRGGSPVLNNTSVDELFKPMTSCEADQALRGTLIGNGPPQMARLWTQTDNVDDVMHVSYCMAGVVNSEDVPGRRKKGTINWGGLPSLAWWVDRESGIAASLFMQVMPILHVEAQKLMIELETALYRMVDTFAA